MLIEACVDTLASAANAEAGGADRIELCANLADAGTTPSHGTLALALERLTIPVFPIIRPRGGGFVHDASDADVIVADLRHAVALGAPGAVIGALTADGDVDRAMIGRLRAIAPAMRLTFHRAFDACRDPGPALEALIELGVDRLLTSGQAATAWEGRALIAALVRQSNGRIVIMAGGDVDEGNAAALVRETGVQEIHVRGTSPVREVMLFHGGRVPFRRALSNDETRRSVTDPARLRAIRAAIPSR